MQIESELRRREAMGNRKRAEDVKRLRGDDKEVVYNVNDKARKERGKVHNVCSTHETR